MINFGISHYLTVGMTLYLMRWLKLFWMWKLWKEQKT